MNRPQVSRPMERMKKRLMLTVGVIAAVSGSAAAYYHVNQAKDAPQFTTAAVTRGDVIESVEATGTLEAVTTVQVGSQTSGVIKALYADFNSHVRKGQVIAELDPALFQTQVDQAQATVARLQADVDRAKVQLEDAQTKLTRAKQLKDQGLIQAADLDTADTTARTAEAALTSAEAQVVQARASLSQNRVTLDHAIITAPIDGVVVSRNVDVGQTVAASMSAPTLFVIANDLTRMQVSARVDESDIGRITSGQPVTFHVDAYPDQIFTGTVSQVRLQPVVEQNVVSYVTVVDVPNPDLKLKPGMTANVTVEVAKAADTLKVPTAALRFRPTAPAGGRGPRIWTLENGQLHPVPVQPGISDGVTSAIAAEGLTEGTEVVTGIAVTQTAGSTPAAGSPLIPRFGNRGRTGGGGAAAQPRQSAGGATAGGRG
jgi:HlyD family secretion protein